MMTTNFTIAKCFIALAACLLVSGCSKHGNPRTIPSTPVHLSHTVKYQGETLAAIAKWYTGDHENWRAIARENPMVNPARMQLGTVLTIPSSIVKRSDPFPASAIPRSMTGAKKSNGAKTGKQSATKEADPLPGANDTFGLPEVSPNPAENQLVGESASEFSVESQEATTMVPPTPTESDVRIRTRDELLDELLQ